MNDKEYQEREKQIDEAIKHNKEILIEFEKYLKTKSLKPKTIRNHISNIELFANSYLLYYEIIPIEKGFSEIGCFLGDFLIRKVALASKITIQENIASFNKFYTFLYEIGKISKKELDKMKELIKEEKEDWIKEVEDYWNVSEDDLL